MALAASRVKESGETLVKLGKDRVAHIWMKARNPQELAREMALAQGLRFSDSRISGR